MRLATFLRLSLLGPLVLPPVAALLPFSSIAMPAVILSVGILYYGFGYALFAVGVLYWMRRPRPTPVLLRAALLAPLIASPLIAISVATFDHAFDTGRGTAALTSLIFWMGLTILVGYCYVFCVLFVARLLGLRPKESLSHAV